VPAKRGNREAVRVGLEERVECRGDPIGDVPQLRFNLRGPRTRVADQHDVAQGGQVAEGALDIVGVIQHLGGDDDVKPLIGREVLQRYTAEVCASDVPARSFDRRGAEIDPDDICRDSGEVPRQQPLAASHVEQALTRRERRDPFQQCKIPVLGEW